MVYLQKYDPCGKKKTLEGAKEHWKTAFAGREKTKTRWSSQLVTSWECVAKDSPGKTSASWSAPNLGPLVTITTFHPVLAVANLMIYRLNQNMLPLHVLGYYGDFQLSVIIGCLIKVPVRTPVAIWKVRYHSGLQHKNTECSGKVHWDFCISFWRMHAQPAERNRASYQPCHAHLLAHTLIWGSLPHGKVINYVASRRKCVETRLSLFLNTLSALVNRSCCCRPFFGSFSFLCFPLAVVTAVMVSSWFAKRSPLHLGVSVCGRLENLFCNLIEPMFRSPSLN